MQILLTEIPEVRIISPRLFGDDRGYFMETYRQNTFAELGIECEFVQDNHSFSVRDTLRGLHYQITHPQAKLCRVITGRVLDIAVDIRRGSPTFGRWVGMELSEENHHMAFIPAGFAHGFVVLSETAHFLYKCSDYYDPAGERGLVWNDPQICIGWPLMRPILSSKDSRYPTLAEIAPSDLPAFEPQK